MAEQAELEKKPTHTIILDSSPLLLNQPSISTLLANSHALITTPSVMAEIKTEEARQRIETLYMPFLTIRSPRPESVRLVKEFAKKTGDGSVLSQTDFEILALAYDLECERNGGDWRLRSTPGQKRVNGSPPKPHEERNVDNEKNGELEENSKPVVDVQGGQTSDTIESAERAVEALDLGASPPANETLDTTEPVEAVAKIRHDEQYSPALEDNPSDIAPLEVESQSQDSDSDGWITPVNIKKHQARDEAADNKTKSETKTLQVATMTGDFAMQNVLLQMNLNLLSTKTCKRIAEIKQFILRCHACFLTTRDMSKQFCPRCGKPTLTRVTCTTNDKGEVKLHLKANMQWNNRGNVYSIPKPTGGTSNQKWQGPRQGGGQSGWGNDLILTEDQKEYSKAVSSRNRARKKDLMDEDALPSLLSGDRSHGGGRIRIGAGRSVNSRKR